MIYAQRILIDTFSMSMSMSMGLCLLALNGSLLAKEVEPHGTRKALAKSEVRDGADFINGLTNRVLRALEGKSCDSNISTEVFKIMGKYRGNATTMTKRGRIEKLVDEAIEADQAAIKQWERDYLDHKLARNAKPPERLGFYAITDFGTYVQNGGIRPTAGLSPSIKLCQNEIGTDKLGQFFSEGFELFSQLNGSSLPMSWARFLTETASFLYPNASPPARLIPTLKTKQPNRLDQALLWAWTQEFKEGIGAPRFVSYADLMTSFMGAKFYQELNQPGAATAFKSINSYVKCDRTINQLVRTEKKFNWCDYVTSAWDEAVNCSDRIVMKKNKPIGLEPVNEFYATEKKGKWPCPINLNECYAAIAGLKGLMGVDYSQERASFLIHRKCLSPQPEAKPSGSLEGLAPASSSSSSEK